MSTESVSRQHGWNKISTRHSFAFTLILISFLFVWSYPVLAQDVELNDGAAVLTTFSGLRANRGGEDTIDRRGVVIRGLDLSNPGVEAEGNVITVPEIFTTAARDVGQVFAVTFDDESPANIFVAATSTYGLFRESDNDDWVRGMWGRDGGPGAVYKLDAENDYRAEHLFSVELDGRPNTGAGLGDITYDPMHNQLFVSDLETGMIHRFNIQTGAELSVFDHGIDGRTRFLDVESGETSRLDDVSFDTRSEANVFDCGSGPASAAAARFMSNPNCWNFAPYKRRVWGIAFRKTSTNQSRLYYSTWGSSAFGNPNWDPSDEDATNAVWSVGLNANGSFDGDDVRREFFLPPFYVSRQDRADFGGSHPVTSIEFDDQRVMLVAERGMHLGRQEDPNAEPSSVVSAQRVLRYILGEDRKWVVEGRYDVGSGDRADEDPPHIRANGAGGIALGHGYTRDGEADPLAANETLWVTGHRLCDEDFPCIDASRRDPVVHGLQGLPAAIISELSPVASFLPYPADGPAIPDVTTIESYFIAFGEAGEGHLAGDIGDVAIVHGAAPADAPFDLGINKSGPAVCKPGGHCIFDIDVTNAGGTDYSGPIYLSDNVGGGFTLVEASPDSWACIQNGARLACRHEEVILAPGQSLSLRLDFRVPGNIRARRIDNCVAIEWPGQPGREQIRAVQLELTRRGFNPGTPDGVPGRRTANAIRAAESALGLPITGEITDDLLTELFGAKGLLAGDSNPRNDDDCVPVDIDRPDPVHSAQISAFHRSYRSNFHNQATSGPIETHDPAVSNFHLRFRSSMHDGRTTRPVPVHRNRVSSFHQDWNSRLHETRTSRHLTGLSQFHDRFDSGQHNAATSRRIPVHRNRISRFHQNNQSRFHDNGTSRHSTGLSQFHSQNRSNQHVRNTSRLAPVHNPVLSQFHSNGVSRFHNTANSRHRTGLSQFHGQNRSNQHVRNTSRLAPVHNPALSQFHSNGASRFHNTANSRHRTGLSQFHAGNRSNLHLQNTSRVRPPQPRPQPQPIPQQQTPLPKGLDLQAH